MQKYRAGLVQELKNIIGPHLPLFGMLGYQMGWLDERGGILDKEYSGKLLRPGFCLLCCQATGGDWTVALPAAASIEIVHNFSLVHDDIEDGSSLRRHRRTLWAVWGEARAINAGDAMHILAETAMLRLSDRGVLPETVLRALAISNRACLRLCEGQDLDLVYEQRLDIKTDDYLKMISGKTAALFEAAFMLGTLLGNGSETAIRKAGVCGNYLGLAFQITDDILGVWGDVETGKSAESDLLKKKKTFPVVFGLEKTAGKDRSVLLEFFARAEPSHRDVAEVKSALESTGAREYAVAAAKKFYSLAMSELDSSGLQGDALGELKEAALTAVVRRF
ncbi:MAG: polyprenyl synthetase family protein [Chloroflexi bacterium]|nr:polyprenyl synthetase family protein [Chloroflexota bacterium]